MKDIRLLLAIIFISIGLFGDKLPQLIDIISNAVSVEKIDYNLAFDLKRPSDATLSEIGDMKSLVTPQQDRELLAAFHNEMGKRISSYSGTDTISLEDYYLEAAKIAFDGKLSGKYPEFGSKIQQLIKNSVGEFEGSVTDAELTRLSENFRSVAWILLN